MCHWGIGYCHIESSLCVATTNSHLFFFGIIKRCGAADAEILLKESLQLVNNVLLLLCSATAAEAGDRRHYFVNVCSGGFYFTVTESIFKEPAGILRL